jgi:hypothetical protein
MKMETGATPALSMVCHDDDRVLCGTAFIRINFFQPGDQTVPCTLVHETPMVIHLDGNGTFLTVACIPQAQSVNIRLKLHE